MKSKNGSIGDKVADGAYYTMIERIQSIENPNFFFMHYGKTDLKVKNFVVVPKYFFVPEMIEKRKPLSDSAQRAGWIGCNINFKAIPENGKIYIVKNEKEQPLEDIVSQMQKMNFIRDYKMETRGWVLDVLNCINMIPENEFSLGQLYQYEKILSEKYPENHHVKDKIRQQLQVLRDKGVIEFLGRGRYRKL